MIQQNKELIKKWEETFISNLSKVTYSDTFSTFEINTRLMYALTFGNLPRVKHSLARLNNGDFIFIKNVHYETDYSNLEDSLMNEIYFKETCEKLGVVLYPSNDLAVYVTDIGVIYISTSNRMGQIGYIKNAWIHANNDEDAKILGETFSENVVKKEDIKNSSSYFYVVANSNYLSSEKLSFDNVEINLKDNYNDDIPYENIIKALKSNKNELVLFSGKPGTGKTTLIKHLMSKIKEKSFYYFDSSLLLTISPSIFMDFMLSHRDSVIVIEDCEKLLCKREDGNPFMSTLLNLTDGIIGESVKAKFLCTFNCQESKIDDALLREGRLSLKYTFNELSLDKTKKLVENAEKPMTLATIYKKDKTKIVGDRTERKKIGF